MTRLNIAPQPNAQVLDGFYDPATGEIRIQLGLPVRQEGSVNCAFAMDASASMAEHYRHRGLINKSASDAEVFIRKTGAFVAQLDSDGGVQVYLWATGDGRQIVDLGNHPGAELEKLSIKTNVDSNDKDANQLGNGTWLRPALDRIVREIAVDSGAAMTYIVAATDGNINDFNEVIAWTTEKAKAIAAGTHPKFKIVLVGFDDANPAQMQALDNLDTGTDVDIFDAQSATDLEAAANHLTDEALTSQFKVAESGRLEANGQTWPFQDGVPQRIDTRIATGLTSVSLVIVENGADAATLEIALPNGSGVTA